MKTKYTNKQIWMIAYPILISLLMEQMIGNIHGSFRFQYRSADTHCPAQR